MHFCSVCNNMYYISVTTENELQYYCRNCGNIDNTVASENICVSKLNVKHSTTPQSFSQVVNKYTKLDPTLPRIKTIRCPNDDCISNKKSTGSLSSSSDDGSSSSRNLENEVIYHLSPPSPHSLETLIVYPILC